MEISSRIKVNKTGHTRHHIYIEGMPLTELKKKRHKYYVKLKKSYTYQKTVIKIELDHSIIQHEENVNKDLLHITFKDGKLNITIHDQNVDQKFIKWFGRYRKNLVFIDEGISLNVKSQFNPAFYEGTILTRIRNIRDREKQQKNKNQNKTTRVHEELFQRDLYYADKFSYHESPNSDGSRSRREVFGGTFSGSSRSGGKRRRK